MLVEDWADICLHRAERMPIRAIARHLGISRNTVKRAPAMDRPPKHERAAKGSAGGPPHRPPGRRAHPARPLSAVRGGRGGIGIHPLRCRGREPVLPARLEEIQTRVRDRHQQQTVRTWGEVFGDETVAAVMIDWLVHHEEVHSLKGDSYRMKGRELGRVPTAKDND